MKDHHHGFSAQAGARFRRGPGGAGFPGFPGNPGFPGHGNPFGGNPFDGPWFAPGPRHHGSRARKGDVRSVILILLSEAPSNGYGLIKSIAAKTAGTWRPSPGSVYPTLQQLVDEGLIRPTGSGPRTEFELTDEGRSYVEENRDQLASAWTASSETLHQHGQLMASAAKLAGVIRQVHEAGTPEQRDAAATKLDDLRRELYRMLGE